MKKILLTILLITSPVFAYEDYMVISDEAVQSVSVQKENFLDAKVLFTIDNEKRFVILTPKNVGETKVYLKTNNGHKQLDVRISKDKTDITSPEGITCYELDIPPEAPYIPLPPANIILPNPPKGVK